MLSLDRVRRVLYALAAHTMRIAARFFFATEVTQGPLLGGYYTHIKHTPKPRCASCVTSDLKNKEGGGFFENVHEFTYTNLRSFIIIIILFLNCNCFCFYNSRNENFTAMLLFQMQLR